MLGQPFPQLPQLQQGGVGIVREVALRQRAQPEQLLVVGAEVGEVGAHDKASNCRTRAISSFLVKLSRGGGGGATPWSSRTLASASFDSFE